MATKIAKDDRREFPIQFAERCGRVRNLMDTAIDYADARDLQALEIYLLGMVERLSLRAGASEQSGVEREGADRDGWAELGNGAFAAFGGATFVRPIVEGGLYEASVEGSLVCQPAVLIEAQRAAENHLFELLVLRLGWERHRMPTCVYWTRGCFQIQLIGPPPRWQLKPSGELYDSGACAILKARHEEETGGDPTTKPPTPE